MEVLTRKLDRSMRLQIPQNFASELGLEPGSEVSVTMQGESIVIRHARQPNLLDTLLEGVNDSNLHGETGTGSSIGREEW
jgi:antitoxin component of MazEF toxin-antitoxin module